MVLALGCRQKTSKYVKYTDPQLVIHVMEKKKNREWGTEDASMGKEVTVLKSMVREGFSELLIVEQRPTKGERASPAEIWGKDWRKSKDKGRGVAAWLVHSRRVRYLWQRVGMRSER